MAGLVMTRAQGWAALEAAGIKVWRAHGRARAYEPGRDGAWVALRDGFRDATWASYPEAVQATGPSAKVSGRFAAECRDALRAARLKLEAVAPDGPDDLGEPEPNHDYDPRA